MVLFVDFSNGTIGFLRKYMGNLGINPTIQTVIFNKGLWLFAIPSAGCPHINRQVLCI